MEDLRAILSLLSMEQPPLLEKEQQDLDLVIKKLSTKNTSRKRQNEDPKPNENVWLTKPELLIIENPDVAEVSFEVPKSALVVDSNGKDGCFKTIEDAVAASNEGSVIFISAGIYQTVCSIPHSLTILANNDAIIKNSLFTIKSSTVHMTGLKFETDTTTIESLKGDIYVKRCRFDCTGLKPLIDLQDGASLTMENTCMTSHKAVESISNTQIKIMSCSISGTITCKRSGIVIQNSSLTCKNGPAIQVSGSQISLENSVVHDCVDTGINSERYCSLVLERVVIRDVKGYGIKVQEVSTLKSHFLQVSNCSKSAIMVSTNSLAELTGACLTNCGHSGIEVLVQSSITLNETWISKHAESCIFCDIRSSLNITRCSLSDCSNHGVQMTNGSSAKVSDTLIRMCQGSGLLASKSAITCAASEFSENLSQGLSAEDHSRVDLTNCNILNNCGDGIKLIGDSRFTSNNCFVQGNRKVGISILECIDFNLHSSFVGYNENGGLILVESKMVVIDNCHIQKNDLHLSGVESTIIRKSLLQSVWTKIGNNPIRHIEVQNGTEVTFDENDIIYCIIRVKQATAVIRSNVIEKSPNFAVNADYRGIVHLENNTMKYNRSILVCKDHSEATVIHNNISNITKSKNSQFAAERKTKIINIKSYSSAVITANEISGEYDYAIFVDLQSNVKCKANQVQNGLVGTITFTGASSGLCEDNTFTGAAVTNPVEFSHGCTQLRR